MSTLWIVCTVMDSDLNEPTLTPFQDKNAAFKFAADCVRKNVEEEIGEYDEYDLDTYKEWQEIKDNDVEVVEFYKKHEFLDTDGISVHQFNVPV